MGELYLHIKCTNCDNETLNKFDEEEMSIKDVPETMVCDECYETMIIRKVYK